MIAWLLAALTLTVTPRMAFAPAVVRARVQFEASAGDRWLVVDLVSDDFAQRTELPIDARRPGRQTFWIAPWTRVPAGDFLITAAVVDARGRITDRQTTTVHLEPGVSR